MLKSGGAGCIHLLHDEPHSVAKIYHGHVDAELARRRVEAMLRLVPQLPDIAEDGRRYVQLDWRPSVGQRERVFLSVGNVMYIVVAMLVAFMFLAWLR